MQLLRAHTVVLLSLLLTSQVQAGLVTVSAWAGTWRDKAGGLIAIDDKEGILDVSGTDSESIYRVVCVIDAASPKTAACTGDGVNHKHGFRFTYRSEMQLGPDGMLVEDWQALSRRGTAKGRASFSRAPAADSSR